MRFCALALSREDLLMNGGLLAGDSGAVPQVGDEHAGVADGRGGLRGVGVWLYCFPVVLLQLRSLFVRFYERRKEGGHLARRARGAEDAFCTSSSSSSNVQQQS